MNLNALGYVGIRTRNLEDWASYGTRFRGMQLLELLMRDPGRVVVHPGPPACG